MTEEDKLGVLQAYSDREANDGAGFWAEGAGGTATSKKYKSYGCFGWIRV